MKLIVLRTIFTENATAGIILANDKFIGYTLEDRTRPIGQKIDGKTCIPAGKYFIKNSMSNRFGRVMPEILDIPNFTGVRIHGGNSVEDSSGCILVATYRVSKERIQNSIEKTITNMLEIKEDPPNQSTIEIINTSNSLFYL